MGQHARRANAETPMRVDINLDIRPDRIAHRHDIVHAAAQVGPVGVASKAPERIELQAAIAGSGRLAGSAGDIVRTGFGVMPAIGIGWYLLVHAPAEQVV